MAFKIVKQARAWWPVTWDGVAEDGAIVENRIELRFHLLKVDQAAKFVADVVAARSSEDEGGADLPTIYAALVERIADNWRGVEAENGEALPWSIENLRLLMNEPRLFTHVFAAFRECLAGGDGIRTGN